MDNCGLNILGSLLLGAVGYAGFYFFQRRFHQNQPHFNPQDFVNVQGFVPPANRYARRQTIRGWLDELMRHEADAEYVALGQHVLNQLGAGGAAANEANEVLDILHQEPQAVPRVGRVQQPRVEGRPQPRYVEPLRRNPMLAMANQFAEDYVPALLNLDENDRGRYVELDMEMEELQFVGEELPQGPGVEVVEEEEEGEEEAPHNLGRAQPHRRAKDVALERLHRFFGQ